MLLERRLALAQGYGARVTVVGRMNSTELREWGEKERQEAKTRTENFQASPNHPHNKPSGK